MYDGIKLKGLFDDEEEPEHTTQNPNIHHQHPSTDPLIRGSQIIPVYREEESKGESGCRAGLSGNRGSADQRGSVTISNTEDSNREEEEVPGLRTANELGRREETVQAAGVRSRHDAGSGEGHTTTLPEVCHHASENPNQWLYVSRKLDLIFLPSSSLNTVGVGATTYYRLTAAVVVWIENAIADRDESGRHFTPDELQSVISAQDVIYRFARDRFADGELDAARRAGPQPLPDETPVTL